MPRATRSTGVWWTITALSAASVLLLGACSSGSSTTASDSGGSTTPTTAVSSDGGSGSGSGGSSASGSKPTGKPLEKFRVGNFYTAKGGGPGPSLDIYSFASGGDVPTVLLKDVAYGTISKYVDPPTYSDSMGGRSFQIGAVKAGTKVKTQEDLTGLGGAGSKPPEYDKQVTIVLTADLNDQEQMTGTPLAGMSNGSIAEHPGPTRQGSDPQPTLPPKPSGGELFVTTRTFQSTDNNSYYLTVDGTCAKPTNGLGEDTGPYAIVNSSDHPSLGAIYEVGAGSHDLTIGLSQEKGVPPTSCDALVKVGDGSVTTSAGSQVLVIPYTSDSGKTVKFASATIDD